MLTFPKNDVFEGNLPYTRRVAKEELSLLERHLRDGSAELCGCAFDNHLPLLSGLATEGVKFAENETEKKFYESMREWAQQRIKDLLSGDGYPTEKLIKETRDRRLFIVYEEWKNPSLKEKPLKNPCKFKSETVMKKEFFDRKSFRTLCPQCPKGLCSNCPPEECFTEVVVGCKKGHFKKGQCHVPIEAHKILHV